MKKNSFILLFLAFTISQYVQAEDITNDVKINVEYYENGQKKSETRRYNSARFIEDIDYNENGKIHSYAKYNLPRYDENNIPHVSHDGEEEKVYYDNGNIEFESIYNLGIREEKTYFEDGKLKLHSKKDIVSHILEEDEYSEDGLLRKKIKEISKDDSEEKIILYSEQYDYKKNSIYDGNTETITTFYYDDNVHTKEVYNDLNKRNEEGEILLEYREYTIDGKEYSFVFEQDEPFKPCLAHGSLGEGYKQSYCRPYKKYLDEILLSTMDENQVYQEFYPDGKIKQKCTETHLKRVGNWNKIIQDCIQYVYDNNGFLEKEENNTIVLRSWGNPRR